MPGAPYLRSGAQECAGLLHSMINPAESWSCRAGKSASLFASHLDCEAPIIKSMPWRHTPVTLGAPATAGNRLFPAPRRKSRRKQSCPCPPIPVFFAVSQAADSASCGAPIRSRFMHEPVSIQSTPGGRTKQTGWNPNGNGTSQLTNEREYPHNRAQNVPDQAPAVTILPSRAQPTGCQPAHAASELLRNSGRRHAPRCRLQYCLREIHA